MNRLKFETSKKTTTHFRGTYGIYPNSIKNNPMVSTCNGRLDLGTLGFRLIMPTNLPGHCLWRGKVDSNNFRWLTLEVLEEIESKWANRDLSILHPTRYNITLLNVMGPRNTTIRCYEFNLNLSLLAQLFEHLTSIF